MYDAYGFFETGKRVAEKGRRSPFRRVVRGLFNLALILTAVAVVGVGGLYAYAVTAYGERFDRRYPVLPQTSYVYDMDGEKIAEIQGSESRETVGPEGLGEYLPDAVVAIEDRRFYDHFGVDLEGVARAAWTDLRAWEVHEGGSTITEQLMKNVYVPEEHRFEVSFWRRFVQAALAFAYERDHSKEEILTAYLNAVYFGRGAYGAEEAAQRYFGKSAEALTLSEAATLAGFLHAPSTYSTAGGRVLADKAYERRDQVLEIMRMEGMISASEQRRAAASRPRFVSGSRPEDPAYLAFVEKVRREVEGRLGEDALERGGLRIHATLDSQMQREALEAVEETLYAEDDPSAAIATVEPQTGAIRALAGRAGTFNLALDARRQPGSSFKAVVLAAALRAGISPESTYVSQDLKVRFEGEEYLVANYGYINRGEISISEAMAESDNTVFVQLASDLGYGNVARMARMMGVSGSVEPYPSTALGGLGVGVSPLEMASVYATFAAGGVYREPYSVERVYRVNYGERTALYDHPLVGRRVMSGGEAAVATGVLRGVVEHGTASRYHDLDAEIGRPSAGKTGTTDEFVDAWYVGYTPRLSTAVWVGYPQGNRSMVGVRGLEEVNGETLPLDIWASYMARATAGDPPLDFPEPDLSELRVVYNGYPGF